MLELQKDLLPVTTGNKSFCFIALLKYRLNIL